jgi:hypothetical protein
LDVMGGARSAWAVSCSQPMPWPAQVSRMNCSANGRALAMGHHPADHVPAEHVEHDVEVEVGPLRRPEPLRDIPTPQLVGPAGQQLRGGIDGCRS